MVHRLVSYVAHIVPFRGKVNNVIANGVPPVRDGKRNTYRILTKKSRPVKAGSFREERKRSFVLKELKAAKQGLAFQKR